ncbi:hypothetical protein AK812_SmicGene14023 [Symbiodinium microadriaticum]|uniref:Uncharacterized protein n=1 Tax=Symbiodinium microadriaticum TaxID=2951 RepID=A0A1Q9E6M3_SYMMI|nr:hypothetical protein AK812_SmicGene14023 [Symbiodinium microadriaticum]
MAKFLLLTLCLCACLSSAQAGWGSDEWSGWSSKGKGYGGYNRGSFNSGGKGWGKGKASSSSFSFERGFMAGQQLAQAQDFEEVAATSKRRRRRHRRRAAEDSSNSTTPETTPEKQKPKVSKLKDELKELRSYRQRMEKAQAEEEQDKQLKALEAKCMEAISQIQKSSSAASSVKGQGTAEDDVHSLSGIQRKLASRMFREYDADFEPETWEHVAEFIQSMSGKHTADYLKTAQMPTPKTLKVATLTVQRLPSCTAVFNASMAYS